MGFWDLLFLFRDERPVFSLAADVARRCEGAVWEKVAAKIARMTAAESRGYVRARAGTIVSRHLDLVALSNPRLVAGRRERILQLALDGVVSRVAERQRIQRQRFGQDGLRRAA